MKSLFSRVRTLLILGRVSNLPTVWSNLIAGCFLAGGDRGMASFLHALIPLLTGVSFLYIGGMYLNDFCDAKFDMRYCPERPIPAKKISRTSVGILAAIWLALGLAGISRFGILTLGIGIVLTGAIVLYDFWHKDNPAAPLIMGACRFVLYPLAGSIMQDEMSWRVFVWAAPMALYVAGITWVARGESRPGKPARWALSLLLIPFVVSSWFALEYGVYVIFLFWLLPLGWMAWLFIPLWRGTNRSIGRVVSGLLAGIILIDAMVLAEVLIAPIAFGLPVWGLIYLALFLLALLLQRIIPAT